MERPIYYRWVFKPSTGSVDLSHNDEAPPAEVRYHTELAQDAGEPNTYHGYAYRIGKGWRIFDWENKPVNDPHVVAQVLRAIRKKEGPMLPHPDLDDWTEVEEPNIDPAKLHYG